MHQWNQVLDWVDLETFSALERAVRGASSFETNSFNDAALAFSALERAVRGASRQVGHGTIYSLNIFQCSRASRKGCISSATFGLTTGL